MKRQVDYTWQLRKVMAKHGMFQTTELVPLLRDRGIDLSASQVHRLVTGTPERLSLAVLAALCDIFDTDPAELITATATNTGVRRTAVGDQPAPAQLAQLRPKRARITPEP
jgi:DNA-binding Xre family transcriptional regulator